SHRRGLAYARDVWTMGIQGKGEPASMVVVSTALNRLKQAALRPTAVRIAILQALEKHGHPTTEELIQRLNHGGGAFGRATIYQNLQKLVDAALVRELMGDDGVQRYDG